MALPLIYVGYKVMPGCSKYATGVPGTLDHLLWQYGLLNFVLGALQSWCAANNSTIYAEVRALHLNLGIVFAAEPACS